MHHTLISAKIVGPKPGCCYFSFYSSNGLMICKCSAESYAIVNFEVRFGWSSIWASRILCRRRTGVPMESTFKSSRVWRLQMYHRAFTIWRMIFCRATFNIFIIVFPVCTHTIEEYATTCPVQCKFVVQIRFLFLESNGWKRIFLVSNLSTVWCICGF